MCYYYHGSQSSPPDAYGGAIVGVANADNDFADPTIYFSYPNPSNGSTDGEHDPMDDNAGSGINGREDCKAHIYTGPSQTGTPVTLAAYPQSGYKSPDLGGINNSNRSQKFC